MRERMAFGPELRRARERRGLSLEQVAERTKVAASLYAGLERNDLSRWPSGLFRRAFVRAYAEAVGLDPEDVCRRFVALFPEEGGAPAHAGAAPAAGPPAEAAEQPRLTLAVPTPPARQGSRFWHRAAAAGVDIALAVVPAALISLVAGLGWFWIVTVTLGVVGHAVALIAHGTTPGGWLLLGPRPILGARHEAPAGGARRPEVVAGTAGPGRQSRQSTRAVAGRRFQH